MQTNYYTTMQNGKEVIILLLLCLQISSVLAYSNFVPVVDSVCDDFLTSHGGKLNSTVASTKRVWVELWDSSKQNRQSCFEHGASYKVSIKSTSTITNQSDHVKGFLFGTTTGTLPGDSYGDLPSFASELKCRNTRRHTRISHRRPLSAGTDLTFNYNAPTSESITIEIFRAAITYAEKENLEDLKFEFPLCRNETSSTVMLQTTSTITPSSTFSIAPTSIISNNNVTFTPTPTSATHQCSCNSSTTPTCGKEIGLYNRTLNHFSSENNKTYICQSRLPLRNVTCTNTCNRECPTDSNCGMDIDCTVFTRLKIKKFNCYKVDSRGNILEDEEPVLLRLKVTMHTGCTCKQREHL